MPASAFPAASVSPAPDVDGCDSAAPFAASVFPSREVEDCDSDWAFAASGDSGVLLAEGAAVRDEAQPDIESTVSSRAASIVRAKVIEPF